MHACMYVYMYMYVYGPPLLHVGIMFTHKCIQFPRFLNAVSRAVKIFDRIFEQSDLLRTLPVLCVWSNVIVKPSQHKQCPLCVCVCVCVCGASECIFPSLCAANGAGHGETVHRECKYLVFNHVS